MHPFSNFASKGLSFQAEGYCSGNYHINRLLQGWPLTEFIKYLIVSCNGGSSGDHIFQLSLMADHSRIGLFSDYSNKLKRK